MSLFPQTKTVQTLVTIGGATPSIGGQPVRVVIPRQSRRLQKIRVHARFNVTTALAGGADFGIGLAGLLSRVRLTVSDAAGSNRLAIDTTGPTLHALNRKWEQSVDRYTQYTASVANLAVANGYDLFWTIPVRYPVLEDPIGYRTSMPLDENYAKADPILELTFPATMADIGYSAGALTIAGMRATFYWDEINDAALLRAGKPLAYVPQELKTLDSDPNGLIWNFERGGWLAGILVEEFTDTARTLRGTALANPLVDYYSVRYGRSDLRQFYTEEAVADDDAYAISPAMTALTTHTGGDHAVSLVDFLAQRPQGAIVSGSSMLNLYTDNAGDSVTLTATALSATGKLRLTTHKFLTPDPGVLFGG